MSAGGRTPPGAGRVTAGVAVGLVSGPVLGGVALLGVLLSYLLVVVHLTQLVRLLPPGVRALAAPERSRLRGLLGADTPSPPRRPLLGFAAAARDRQTWRDTGFLAGQVVLGPLAFAVVAAVWGLPVFLLSLLAWGWRVDRVPLGVVTLTSGLDVLLAALAGLLLLPVAALLVRAFGRALAGFAERSLGADVHARLAVATARAEELERTRAIAVSAAAGERKRLERDLHDGAQSRLVSLAMTLALAEEALGRDPESSRELLQEARADAVTAVEELRTLSRGLAPTVLRARGLLAGLDALAAAQPVPTSVTATAYADPAPEEVETALWFAAAEALTNAAKHAAATSVEVRLASDADGWLLVVADDGAGGAVAGPGGGLAGLRDRLAPLDGVLDVDSGPSGTSVMVQVPR